MEDRIETTQFVCIRCKKLRPVKSKESLKYLDSKVCRYCVAHEKASRTLRNLTKEQKLQKQQHLKALRSSIPESTKKRAVEKRLSTMANRTAEQKKLSREKRNRTILNRSEDAKSRIRENHQKYWKELSPEKMATIQQKRLKTRSEWSEEKRIEVYNKVTKTQSEWSEGKKAEIRNKKISTWKSKYGVEHPMKCARVKLKQSQTLLERYGVSESFKKSDFKEKRKFTCLQRYGTENPCQLPEIKQKASNTYFEHTGFRFPGQNPAQIKNRRSRYRFGNEFFDSKPELCFYVYQRDRGRSINRPVTGFVYSFENKEHMYMPDFKVDGQLFEIKGNHFLREDDTWQNPFDHSQDTRYEAKHQCALKNGVRILYSKDYQKCIDYVLEKYGKDFLEICRCKN